MVVHLYVALVATPENGMHVADKAALDAALREVRRERELVSFDFRLVI